MRVSRVTDCHLDRVRVSDTPDTAVLELQLKRPKPHKFALSFKVFLAQDQRGKEEKPEVRLTRRKLAQNLSAPQPACGRNN